MLGIEATGLRKKAFRIGLLASGACMGATLCGTAAIAQEDASADNGQGGLGEIVVTAQRREQSMQDIPVAVTAVTGDTMAANRVDNVTDLTGLAPGLYARANAGGLASPSLAMRGVQSSSSAASQDREVPQYLDGVYIGGTRGAIFNVPDTERIEVLRGPQGTLFGRNATAGAVSIVTRDPTGTFGGTASLTFGNQGQIRTRLTLDTPQIGPFSAYGSYVHDEARGDVRNLGYGTTFDRSSPYWDVGQQSSPKYLGGKNMEEFFAAVKFEPSDSIKMVYKFDYADGKASQGVRTVTALNMDSAIGQMLAGMLAAQPAGGGVYGPTGLNPSDRRPDAFNNGWTDYGFVKNQGHNLTTDIRLSDSLSLKNITAYRKFRVFGPASIAGLDGIEFTPGAALAYIPVYVGGILAAQGINYDPQNPAPYLAAFQATAGQALGNPASPIYLGNKYGQYFAAYEGQSLGRGWQFSSELQLNYTSSFLDLTTGVLFYKAKELAGGMPGGRANFAFTPVPELVPLGGLVDSYATTKSLAGYAQGDIHVTPTIDIQLGGRVTHDKKDTLLVQGGTFVGDRDTGEVVGTQEYPGHFAVTKWTYSAGVNWKPNAGTLVYVKTSNGFLSGGSVGAISFKPENVTSYEAGLKTDLLDRRVRFNLALWQATYKGLQQAQSGATVGHPELGVVVTNSGDLHARGVEAELTTRPVDGLTLGGQVSYTHSVLKNIDPILLLNQDRYEYANMPKWLGGVYGQYDLPVGNAGTTLMLRVDGLYQGKSRAITDPDIATNVPAFAPYEFNPARWLLNARLALRDFPMMGGAKGEIALWGKNLGNSRKPLFGFPFATYLYSDSYQQARTYGVDVTMHF